MAPKKTTNGIQKEILFHKSENVTEQNGFEQKQMDHELFLQAFEKPTQIYRFLKTRSQISPYLMNRNLYYMKYGMTKRKIKKAQSKRKEFKINNMLSKREEALDPVNVGGYMTLTFLGFYDQRIDEKPDEKVGLEVLLVKLCNTKWKESSNPTVKVSLCTNECPVNPNEDDPPSKAPALSIPTNLYNVDMEKKATQYEVVIRVHQDTETENLNPNEVEHYSDNEDDICQAKRRKLGYLETRLKMYNEDRRRLLTEGEYEVLLSDRYEGGQLSDATKNDIDWDFLDLEKIDEKEAFRAFITVPTIKFRLTWTKEPAGAMVERPRSLMPRDAEEHEDQRWDIQKKEKSSNKATKTEDNPQIKIDYHFFFLNNTMQITAKEDLHCPWCSLNCLELYSLLKHLKLTHPRFLFNYMSIPEGARINVSVSELYDSTYVGNPYDMIPSTIRQPLGSFFSRNGPVQRTPITQILVARPNRASPSLAEFLEIDDNDLNGQYEAQRSFVSGHNRAYHYSTTNLPMSAKAVLTDDKEDITDPPWLQIKTSRMIDDFTDVNEGEKEFMKLWNRHVQHYTFVGDCQMPQAMKMFIDERGEEVVRKNLYRNFSLHLINLYEFGIIGSAHVFTAISRMQEFIRSRGLHHDINWGGELGQKLATALSLKEGTSPKLSKPRRNFAGIFPNQTKK